MANILLCFVFPDYLHFVVKSESNVSLVKQEVLPLQTVQDSEHDNTPLKRFRGILCLYCGDLPQLQLLQRRLFNH
jgi:hypothetical protein